MRGGGHVNAQPSLTILLAATLVSASSMVSRAAPTAAAQAQIVLSPDAGPTGTIFELTGSSFPPLSTGAVSFDGIDLGQISSDENGTIRGFFMVPEVRSGPARVRVVFDKARASASFDVVPAAL